MRSRTYYPELHSDDLLTSLRLVGERLEQGWIYVLVNSSIPGLVKVGRTTRAPAERAAELSGATSVATPFVLAFDQEFADCVLAEQEIHAELDRRGLRVAHNREFFRGPPAEIVRVVLQTASQNDAGLPYVPAPSAADLLAEGDRHLFGKGETLQDITEALRCYRLAARRGSVVALERLGAVYAQLRGKSRADRRRAMRYLKEGARRGNYFCYCELARIYAAEGHMANFGKAWDLFFTRRGEAPCAEAEAAENRYVTALRHYLSGCLELGLPPGHLAELKAVAEPLLQALGMALDQVRDAPELRHHLANTLRWAYENLPPRVIEPEPAPARHWLPAWHRRPRRVAA